MCREIPKSVILQTPDGSTRILSPFRSYEKYVGKGRLHNINSKTRTLCRMPTAWRYARPSSTWEVNDLVISSENLPYLRMHVPMEPPGTYSRKLQGRKIGESIVPTGRAEETAATIAETETEEAAKKTIDTHMLKNSGVSSNPRYCTTCG